MNRRDKLRTLLQLAGAGLRWIRHDTRYPSPVPANPKFMSPLDAVGLIRDGNVVAVAGIAANQRASIVYRAIRTAYEANGHPADLTVMNLGGHGGRGIAPGTLEELGRPGLCTRLITSHFETFHAMLDLAAKGHCELQCLPLGTLALLVDALGHGQTSLLSQTGVGTFIDPRVGCGSQVANCAGDQLVSAHGDQLRYRIPPIDVALFNAPAADRHGNIYVKGCATIGDSFEVARAAKRNHGRVIANVGLLVDEGYAPVFLPAKMVDAVVYYPDTEQAPGVFHRTPWPLFTLESDVPIAAGLERVQFVNRLARITAARSPADAAVARLAAATLLAQVPPKATVGIGVGMPEVVSQTIFESGHLDRVTFLVETGVVGGLPSPGIYFGTALCPQQIGSPAEVFARCAGGLDATCLGLLQADGQGNVNVAERGNGPLNFVGPGGFMDLAAAAQTIVFVSAWTARGRVDVQDGCLRLRGRGTPKFVERVDAITFNGRRALEAGKRVFYATHVGLLELTPHGMALVALMPGIDIRTDIVDVTPMPVILPETGHLPRLPRWIVTGERFEPLAPPPGPAGHRHQSQQRAAS